MSNKCRCCNQPMAEAPQVFHYERDGVVLMHREYTLVECHNRACTMFMQTFTSTNYANVDLRKYGVSAESQKGA